MIVAILLISLLVVTGGCIDELHTKTLSNDEVEIIGDQEFIKQVEAALTLLKDKDPEAFYIVRFWNITDNRSSFATSSEVVRDNFCL